MTKNFLDRYELPEHFIRDKYGITQLKYDSNVNMVVDLVTNIIGNCNTNKILDMGCGDGYLLSKFNLTNNFYGFDNNQNAVFFSKHILKNVPTIEKIDFIENNMSSYNNFFDIVIFNQVLEHIPPIYHENIISKIYSILKKDGYLIFSVPLNTVKPHEFHYKHFSFSELKSLSSNYFTLKEKHFIIKKNFWSKIIYNPILYGFIDNRIFTLNVVKKVLSILFNKYFIYSSCEKNAERIVLVLQKK